MTDDEKLKQLEAAWPALPEWVKWKIFFIVWWNVEVVNRWRRLFQKAGQP